jgi:hypothetical protein
MVKLNIACFAAMIGSSETRPGKIDCPPSS